MLKVNEIFGPTIQGEGKNAGKPVMFLRMSGCNLHCIWCDTPHTWNWTGTKFKHPVKYNRKKEEHLMEDLSIYAELIRLGGNDIRHLVVSGGEPLIQQKRLIDLFKLLKEDNWFIEIETNGTVTPTEDVFKWVDQINCSPKLASSGDPEKSRIRFDTLKTLASNPKVNFKFVIDKVEDILEVGQIVGILRQSGNPEIRLMPLCQTEEELLSREPMVQRLCKSLGFIYCTRLSILMSGTKRGV